MRIESRPGRTARIGLAIGLWIAFGAGPANAQDHPAGVPAVLQGDAPGPEERSGSQPAAFAAPSAPAVARAPESSVQRAWQAPTRSFEARIERTRRAALEVGAWNFDPAARALLRGGTWSGTPLERARGAIELSPDLPAAHLALARAQWIQDDAPMDALRSVVSGLEAAGHHTEASLWFAGSGLYILAVALLGGGLLAILLSALVSAPRAAHDLSHLLRTPVPGFAGFAILALLLMLPLMLGEGAVGLGLSLLALGMFYGGNAGRFSLALAAVAVFAGLHPVARLAADVLVAFPSDPVASAAYATAQGLASPVDIARLERAAKDDPLAARGLAIYARQTGNLSRADALYQQLLEDDPADVALINNAANVRLDLGHMRSALDLYGRANELVDSPVVLFNLSQAHGRSFQVDDLNRTLAEAQRANGELVAHFTALQRTKNENFVVDFPLSNRLMWQRVLRDGAGGSLAAEFRRTLAPGRLGTSANHAAGLLALLVGGAWLIALRFEPSRSCVRCGGRQCVRCGHGAGGAELCDSCTRLFYQPEKTDRTLRADRLEALRTRDRRLRRITAIGSVLVPGAAGFLAKRPLLGLLGSLCFVFAASAVFWRAGVVPDPLVAGAAAPIAFLGAAAVAGIAYVGVVASCIALRREA